MLTCGNSTTASSSCCCTTSQDLQGVANMLAACCCIIHHLSRHFPCTKLLGLRRAQYAGASGAASPQAQLHELLRTFLPCPATRDGPLLSPCRDALHDPPC